MQIIKSKNLKMQSKIINLKYIREKKLPIISISFLCILVLVMFLVMIFLKVSPNYIDLTRTYRKPSNIFLFGTDSMGRDIFIRAMYGAKNSILIGIISMFFSSGIGIFYGCISGYFGKNIDKIMMRILEMFLIIPTLITAALIQALFKEKGILEIIIIITISTWMKIAKVVRTEVLKLKQKEYIIASKCLGGSFLHIAKVHLIPNIMPTIIYISSLNMGYAIIAESTLSFLGLGLPTTIPSLGSMMIDAQKDILSNKWWTSFFPGILIIGTVFSVTNIGEFFKDIKYTRCKKI